ncbi:Activating signal cointegrator 1 complex subunit 1, partial [Stegodyphus mimosarum]
MNDDPAEVDVLYAKVQETDGDNCLQIIANLLAEKFVAEGFAKQQHECVKLHVTLMNSLFANKNEETGQSRHTFDARPILEKYGDFDFGEMELNEIHISIR